MNKIRGSFALLLLAVFSAAVFADPIGDGSLDPYKAGWFPNVVDRKALTCPQVCEIKARAAAELEAAPGAQLQKTFVCKVPVGQEDRNTTFLYGNQFDLRPACYTTDTSLRGRYSERFLCLCVNPVKD